jgi:hypothetical protein
MSCPCSARSAPSASSATSTMAACGPLRGPTALAVAVWTTKKPSSRAFMMGREGFEPSTLGLKRSGLESRLLSLSVESSRFPRLHPVLVFGWSRWVVLPPRCPRRSSSRGGEDVHLSTASDAACRFDPSAAARSERRRSGRLQSCLVAFSITLATAGHPRRDIDASRVVVRRRVRIGGEAEPMSSAVPEALVLTARAEHPCLHIICGRAGHESAPAGCGFAERRQYRAAPAKGVMVCLR